MLYKILTQRCPDPEHDLHFLQELQDLYEGGYTILRRAKCYLPRLAREPDTRYQERLRLAAYVSYLGQIVDTYVAHLFAQEIVAQPAADATDPTTPGALPDVDFYTAFAANADLKGTTFANVLRCAFSTALVKRRAYVAVDFPAVEDDADGAASLADEDQLGLARAYAYEVTPEELLDWRYDDVVRVRAPIANSASDVVEFEVGRFAWVVLRRLRDDRESPESVRGQVVEEFKIWRRAEDGTACWELYETPPYDPANPPKPEQDIPLCRSGTTSFKEIPLVELRLPHGLWIGSKVGPLNKEHYQRRSALLASEQLSLYEIPCFFLGSEIPEAGGAMPAERGQDPARADDPIRKLRQQGNFVGGEKDRVEFAGPSGRAFEIVDRQLSALVDEMFRTAHQMAASVSSTANAVGRSGASKQEDRTATQVILGAFGTIVRDFTRRIYGVISEARNEDVVWSAKGLDKFELYDRAEVLDEAMAISTIAIPSRTFAVEHMTQVAQRLCPNLSPETQQTIQREIDQATTAEEVMTRMARPASAPTPAPADADEPDGDEEEEPDGDEEPAVGGKQ